MDIIDTVIRNVHIDARARAKKFQAKSPGKDKTRKDRAKEANVRDALSPLPSRLHASRVKFGPYVPIALQRPLKSILKRPLVVMARQ